MSRFDCTQFELRIHEVLDRRGSLSDDVRLQEHRRKCPSCAELLAEYELLTSVATPAEAELASPQPTPWNGARGSEQRTAQPYGILVHAALILILLGGLSSFWRQDGTSLARATRDELSHWPEPTGAYAPGVAQVAAGRQLAGTAPQSEGAQELTAQAQQFLANIDVLPASLGDLEPYYVYTASLTGVTTLAAPVSFTVDMLRRHLSSPPPPETPFRSDRLDAFSRNVRQA